MNTKALFTRTPDLNHANESLRETIRQHFNETWQRYESLFETLVSDEAYYIKPIALRHPLLFYLGHTATFFTNKLHLAGLMPQRINPTFESMFAVGVDEMRWDDLNDQNYDWPTVAEVKAYRHQVADMVNRLISDLPISGVIDWESPWWIIMMGIEHERIHLETSSVLIRQHALAFVHPHPAWQPCVLSANAPENRLIDVPAGQVHLGKQVDDHTYGWDNEYGNHVTDVAAFSASAYLVSNQEFLAFVDAQGYQTDAYWEPEGLAWKAYTKAHHPIFWLQDQEKTWRLRLMTDVVAMPWDWPVEVNYHEAKAFCNWKKVSTGLNYRLPTEDEWYRLYDDSNVNEIPPNAHAKGNLHLDYWASCCPITQFQQGDFYDVVGNVWQWTETPIYPFEGFKVHPLYDDFTTPTFDGKHHLMKGGSWISCGNETLRSARYAFRRHFFQHAGFRYVIADNPTMIPGSHYESDKLLSEYAEFHYGDNYFGVANFSKVLSDIVIKAMGNKPARSALDLGCAAGRATFELATHFDNVIGVDFSARFIGLGSQLASQGILRYAMADEGELVIYQERTLAELGLDDVKHKVAFFQGDACNLKPHLTGFDFVLAANLIDRLYCPSKFLDHIHERINTGGILMITSPYTWLEEHTPRHEWIGGFKQSGERFTTLDGLKAHLGAHFQLLGEPIDVPFVIRETRRKHQHTIAEVTLWEKIG